MAVGCILQLVTSAACFQPSVALKALVSLKGVQETTVVVLCVTEHKTFNKGFFFFLTL